MISKLHVDMHSSNPSNKQGLLSFTCLQPARIKMPCFFFSPILASQALNWGLKADDNVKEKIQETKSDQVSGEEPVQKNRRIGQSFWANIRSAEEKSENDDDKSDEHDDKLSSTSLLVETEIYRELLEYNNNAAFLWVFLLFFIHSILRTLPIRVGMTTASTKMLHSGLIQATSVLYSMWWW